MYMMKLFIILGALCTMMSVGTGAFGAHGLEGKLSDKYMSVWEKAVNYQMYHGLGLIIIGVISGTTSINVNWAGCPPNSHCSVEANTWSRLGKMRLNSNVSGYQ